MGTQFIINIAAIIKKPGNGKEGDVERRVYSIDEKPFLPS
jgi:hypothetical protein